MKNTFLISFGIFLILCSCKKENQTNNEPIFTERYYLTGTYNGHAIKNATRSSGSRGSAPYSEDSAITYFRNDFIFEIENRNIEFSLDKNFVVHEDKIVREGENNNATLRDYSLFKNHFSKGRFIATNKIGYHTHHYDPLITNSHDEFFDNYYYSTNNSNKHYITIDTIIADIENEQVYISGSIDNFIVPDFNDTIFQVEMTNIKFGMVYKNN